MLCLALALPVSEAAADNSLMPDFEAATVRVSEHLASASEQGASGILRVAYGDKVVFESGFGSASCTEDEAVTPEHIFMIGSITKEFTRLLGFVLEERGVFSLDDTVSESLPGFRGPIGRATLRQLLDHTGGLPDLIDQDGRPTTRLSTTTSRSAETSSSPALSWQR